MPGGGAVGFFMLGPIKAASAAPAEDDYFVDDGLTDGLFVDDAKTDPLKAKD